jgi:hypothetical protein
MCRTNTIPAKVGESVCIVFHETRDNLLGSDRHRFQTEPPVCYRASWQLPGPDSHRQATTSLRPEINYTVHLQSAGRTMARG